MRATRVCVSSVIVYLAALAACAAESPAFDAAPAPPDAAPVPLPPVGGDAGSDARDDDDVDAGDESPAPDAAAPAPLVFAPPVAYACGDGTDHVAIGDFDGDHHPDVAAAFDGGVCVFFGAGDGTLGPAHVVRFDATGGIAARDVSGDGLADLAVTGSGGITAMLALTGGAFATPTSFEGGEPYDAALFADLDGDGALDLVGAKQGRLEAELLTKKGAYRQFVSYAGPLAPSLAAADFDENGREDVAAAWGGPALAVLFPAPDGTITSLATLAAIDSSALAVGDFDRDTHADIAVQGSADGGAPQAQVLLGNGDGTFRPPVASPIPLVGDDAVAADIDRDGRLDLVVTGAGRLFALRGRGDGSFAAAEPIGTLGDGAPAVVDLDGDGRADIVTGDRATKGLLVFLNRSP